MVVVLLDHFDDTHRLVYRATETNLVIIAYRFHYGTCAVRIFR